MKRRIIHGSQVESIYTDDWGVLRTPDRNTSDRRCVVCGVRVCSYKDPHERRTHCYAHDHLATWTHRYIIGVKPGKRPTPCYNGENEGGPLE